MSGDIFAALNCMLWIYALERIAAKISCALGLSPSAATGAGVGIGAASATGAGVGIGAVATGCGAGVGVATGAGAATGALPLFGALFDVSICTPAGR